MAGAGQGIGSTIWATATKAGGSAKKVLDFSASGKVYSVSIDKTRTRLYPPKESVTLRKQSANLPAEKHWQHSDTFREVRAQNQFSDVKYFWVVNAVPVINLFDDNPEENQETTYSAHGVFNGSSFVFRFYQMQITQNFSGSSGEFCGDANNMDEKVFSHRACVLGWDSVPHRM